jgi:hypothetical protein
MWRRGGRGTLDGTEGSAGLGGEESTMMAAYPECLKCKAGRLVPLSDYGRDGAPITYKAWVCSNPECGYNLRIDNGEISMGRIVGPSTK